MSGHELWFATEYCSSDTTIVIHVICFMSDGGLLRSRHIQPIWKWFRWWEWRAWTERAQFQRKEEPCEDIPFLRTAPFLDNCHWDVSWYTFVTSNLLSCKNIHVQRQIVVKLLKKTNRVKEARRTFCWDYLQPCRNIPFSRFLTFLAVRVILMRWVVAAASTPCLDSAEGLNAPVGAAVSAILQNVKASAPRHI